MAQSMPIRSPGSAIRSALWYGLAIATMLAAVPLSARADDRDGARDRDHGRDGARHHDNRDNQNRNEQARRHEMELARKHARDQERWRQAHRYDGYYRRPDVYYSAPPVIYQPPGYYQQPGGSLTFSFPFFNN